MKKVLFFLLLLSACSEVPLPEPGQSFLHFSNDFESNNLSGFYYLLPDTSRNCTIVDSPVRKGNHALKNTLLPDDYINNGYRAELAIYNCAKYKTEVFYGFSLLIDPSYSDLQYNILCQWQDLPDYYRGESWDVFPVLHGSPPPLSLTYVNGTLELKMNVNPLSSNETFRIGDAVTIDKNKWYDLVFHIYWSTDETAFIEAWINNTHITPYNGNDYKFYKTNLYNRAGNYFKFGQYRGKNKTVSGNTVYFDEIKVGSTFNEVSP